MDTRAAQDRPQHPCQERGRPPASPPHRHAHLVQARVQLQQTLVLLLQLEEVKLLLELLRLSQVAQHLLGEAAGEAQPDLLHDGSFQPRRSLRQEPVPQVVPATVASIRSGASPSPVAISHPPAGRDSPSPGLTPRHTARQHPSPRPVTSRERASADRQRPWALTAFPSTPEPENQSASTAATPARPSHGLSATCASPPRRIPPHQALWRRADTAPLTGRSARRCGRAPGH